MRVRSSQAERRAAIYSFLASVISIKPTSWLEPNQYLNASSMSSETLLVGRYRIEAPVGKGGMGEVYRAFDERLNRPLALKRVLLSGSEKANEQARFWREARAIARLEHPAIVEIYDIVEEEGNHWLAMELVEGEPLSRLLASGPLDVDLGIQVFRQIAEALSEAHEKGILHRDLKAENVMVSATGQTKLLDFGLAHSFHRESEETRLTRGIIGTPHAMSPEQAKGKDLDHRSDLFALGSLFYSALTGVKPFAAPQPMDALRKVCQHRQADACELRPEIPTSLSELLNRLLAKEPAERPASAANVANALRPPDPADAPDGHEPRSNAQPPAPGASLPTTTILPSEPTTGVRLLARGGQRRQLTLLMAELVESGGSALDVEDLMLVEEPWSALLANVGAQHEGYLAKALDATAQVAFGYPRADENDARRALRAARVLIRNAAELMPDADLTVKVAISTGPVVVAGDLDADRETQIAFGATAAEAASLLALAPPGGILLGPTAHHLLSGFCESEAMAPVATRGGSGSLVPYRFLADRAPVGGLPQASMVGREQELALAMERWRQLADEGRGQGIHINGEAGIGKSHFLGTLRREVSHAEPIWIQCFCSQETSGTPLQPIREYLRRWFLGEFEVDTVPSRTAGRRDLTAALNNLGVSDSEAISTAAALLGLSDPEHQGNQNPQAERRAQLEGLGALLEEMSEHRPLVFAVEDLHWADPSTLDFLELLIEQVENLRMLLVTTSRPHFEPPWGKAGSLRRVDLGRLGREQVRQLIRQLARGGDARPPSDDGRPPNGVHPPRGGERSVSAALERSILERTDGVPLFVAEVTRTLLASDAGDQSGVPTTLQDLLTARFDALGSTRVIAQIASALGTQASHELLRTVSELDEEALEPHLVRLLSAEVLVLSGSRSHRRYRFRHALFQEAAYASLLAAPRRKLHDTIARALKSDFPELVEREPELLAHHIHAAEYYQEAAQLWLRAGKAAAATSALVEAEAFLRRALEALGSAPEGRERDTCELDCQLTLGGAQVATRGYAAPEVAAAFDRAHQLCRSLDENPALFPALLGLMKFACARAEFDRARDLSRDLLEQATREDDLGWCLEGHRMLGVALFHSGDLDAASSHLEESLRMYSFELHRSHAVLYGSDPGVVTGSYLALLFWQRGQPARARALLRDALELADRTDHPYSLAFAHFFTAITEGGLGDVEKALLSASKMQEIATAGEFTFFTTSSRIMKGWARCHLERTNQGLAEIDQGLEDFRATGSRIMEPYFLGLRAEALNAAGFGRAEQLSAVREALRLGRERGEAWCEPEFLRLESELQ